MPAAPQWLLQFPDIIDELKSLSAPVIDRAVFEKIFGAGKKYDCRSSREIAKQIGISRTSVRRLLAPD